MGHGVIFLVSMDSYQNGWSAVVGIERRRRLHPNDVHPLIPSIFFGDLNVSSVEVGG